MAERGPHSEAVHRGAAQDARLQSLATQLGTFRQRLRYVDYRQAERDCELLAHNVLQVYSRQELRRFVGVPIPRGGLIVLGMLSYMLDLRTEPLGVANDSSTPLLVVDDCALTGRRFAGLLEMAASNHIVFAHLYSHPDLRRGIVEKEQPRVHCCTASHDLMDFARSDFPDLEDYSSWRKRWYDRLAGARYWVGRPQLVCFPWTEPAGPFWNPVTKRTEDGWRFVPPHRCLHNWSELGLPPAPGHIRRWRVADCVASGWFDGVCWLCRTDVQQMYSLEGIGADMWRVLAGYGDLETGTQYLLTHYRSDAATVQADLRLFAQDLCAAGLLERVYE